VAKLNPFGTGLYYAGFIGGSGDDQAIGMKVDGDGNAYVAGTTNSDESTFPVKAGPSLTKAGGLGSADTDAFVAKIAEVSLTPPPGPVSPGPSIPGPSIPGLTPPGPGLTVVAPGVTGYRLTNDPFVVAAGKTPQRLIVRGAGRASLDPSPRCASASWISRPSLRAPRAGRRWPTRSTSPAWPTGWAITATGWLSTTAPRCWPAPAPRS